MPLDGRCKKWRPPLLRHYPVLVCGGVAMVSHLFFYQLTLIALVWLCLMLQWMWPSASAACPTIPEPLPPRPKRHREPQPFAGLIKKPHCDACEPAIAPRPQVPATPPPRL